MRSSSWFSSCTTATLLLLLLASSAFSKLTEEDIEAIRIIVKEDVRAIIKEEIAASEKRMKEHVDLKIQIVNAKIDGTNNGINGLQKQLGYMWAVIIALIGLIAAAIAIPQIMVAYKDISANKRGPQDTKPENISA